MCRAHATRGRGIGSFAFSRSTRLLDSRECTFILWTHLSPSPYSAREPAAVSNLQTLSGRPKLRSAGLSIALVEQPYRVAGRRTPAPASQLDAAWIAVVASARRSAQRP